MIIEVTGAQPKPQPRPRLSRWGGVHYPPSAGRDAWHLAIREGLMRCEEFNHPDFKPFNMPISVSVHYRLRMSKVDRREGVLSAPIKKVYGDIDNMQKCIFDRLTTLGVWEDDSLIVASGAAKWFDDDNPGCTIRINQI